VSRASSASGLAASVVPGQDVPSIAVLPFVNRSRGEEDEYFSDGLADELLNVLTKIRGLRVAARASSFQFKGKNEDLASIGEKLNVATLLDGSVRKAGNRVRISVQLIKAADRVQLWSESYDRSLDDIFAVQDDIAQSVVKELRTTLFGDTPDSDASGRAQADVASASKGHGKNPEAHRLYLQGKFYIDRVNKEDTVKGIQDLNEAVALDPKHAAAWTELARARVNMGGYGWEPVNEGYRKARMAVARALDAQPDYYEGYVVLSNIQRMYEWDWDGAERSARRALELAPGDALAMRTAGTMALHRKRFDEAERLFLAALGQDPLNAGGYTAIGNLYRATERDLEAEAAYRKAIELAPLRIGVRCTLAITLASQGRIDEALVEAGAEPAEWARLTALAFAHHRAGRHKESKEALRTLEERYAAESAYQIGAIHAAYGDVDKSLAWLERAREQRDSGLPLSVFEPVFRPVHDDPRWGEFLGRIGLTRSE
ncbi:MAG TPA: tetratricopeptide repeat protein, partial [Candidatus Eisenbacteria bacterium]|nr:tetratricopeptide repeat protein [Candidatus Eisenbacteria bacterium]